MHTLGARAFYDWLFLEVRVTSSENKSRGRLVGVGCLALLAVIGFDFFLHAGVLSRLYTVSTPFLLEPKTAFRRIPLGYASFGILVVLLEWLMVRLGVNGFRRGTIFGLQLGALVWGSLAVGLASISTARPILLLSWGIGQTVELGGAGAVVGAGLALVPMRQIVWRVVVFFMVCVVLGIVLQNVLVP
jgi:hypothetical protein